MDQQVENFLLNTSNDQSSGIWKLTRTMKAAGYRYKASSDATTKDTTGDPNADTWGPGVQVGAQTATVAFTIAAPSTTSYGGRSVITGLTGFATTSPGHFLKITGATNAANVGTWLITQYVSATSVEIENPAAVAETTPGTATWTELSALLDTFPAIANGSWWCCQGPSTMKIPVGTSAPSGTFIRGENVTQTTSGATGEIMGVVTYTGGGGYLVIAPRKSGTGGGPRGWSTNVITGDVSGATITPTATAIEFVRELVFWKATTTTGHIYCQCIDQASEATPAINGAGRFSAMTGSATTTQCPGGATGSDPTTNGFPTFGTYVALGTGGAGTVATGAASLVNNGTAVNLGKCQFLVANCIEDAGISQDGSITFACGAPSISTAAFIGWGYLRLDDQEDGDVDPYVWYMADTRAGHQRFRTSSGSGGSSIADFSNGTGLMLSAASTGWLGWIRRGYQVNGVPNGDAWLEMHNFILGTTQSITLISNPANIDTVACAIATVKVRDPIYIASWYVVGNTSFKIRKGVLRWWYFVEGGAGCDTYDTKRWIQLASTNATTVFGIVAGPADGTTVPVNQ